MNAAAEIVRRPRPRALLAVVGVVLLGLLGAAGLKSRQDLLAARSREADLVARVADTEARIAALKRRIVRLKDDPVLVETIAREELGLVRPGDVVVLYPEQGSPSQTASATPTVRPKP
jgi:cell division protein FtsB